MNIRTSEPAKAYWGITLLAAAMLMMTMGARQALGLFVAPINSSTEIGLANISLALAVSHFVWGAIQPFAGAAADRYGHEPVLLAGVVILAIGNAITPFMTSAAGLVFSLGIVAAIGSGAGSFSVLMGAVANKLPPERRGMASGIINAGGSFGQFVFAPVTQLLIAVFGWMGAMWSLGAIALAALPIGRALRGGKTAVHAAPAQSAPAASAQGPGLRTALREAFREPSYLMLHAGFFTCGFHVAFLLTHLPGEIQLCGLSANVASWSIAIIGLGNIVGSLLAGGGVQHYRSKYLLFYIYGARAVFVALYLASPRTPLTFYIFAAGLGLTWLATVPPTAALVGKLFGTRYMGTLFGLTLLSHQTGGFFGAWLGGIAITQSGNYEWMWYADITLAALAALCNLPIRETRIAPTLKTA